MNLTIEIPDDIAAALKAQAEAQGVSPSSYARQAIEKSVSEGCGDGHPFQTGYGMWAKYGHAPSAEEIDENRRELFGNFGQGA